MGTGAFRESKTTPRGGRGPPYPQRIASPVARRLRERVTRRTLPAQRAPAAPSGGRRDPLKDRREQETMASIVQHQERKLESILAALAVVASLILIVAPDATAGATCTQVSTYYNVVLEDTVATYTFPFTAARVIDVSSVCPSFESSGQVTIPDGSQVNFYIDQGSANTASQTVIITNWQVHVANVSVNLGGGSSDELRLQGDEGANDLALTVGLSYLNTEVIRLQGMGGADRLVGTEGAEYLDGGAGADQIMGYGGNDVIDGGSAADIMDGGLGTDLISYKSAASGVDATLNGTGKGGDALDDTSVNFEALEGSENADTLTGTSGSEAIHGLGGNDTINGGRGNDTVYGETGDDTLNGGGGDDDVVGGDGSDTLKYGGGTDTFWGNALDDPDTGDDDLNYCQGYNTIVTAPTGTKRYARVSYYLCGSDLP